MDSVGGPPDSLGSVGGLRWEVPPALGSGRWTPVGGPPGICPVGGLRLEVPPAFATSCMLWPPHWLCQWWIEHFYWECLRSVCCVRIGPAVRHTLLEGVFGAWLLHVRGASCPWRRPGSCGSGCPRAVLWHPRPLPVERYWRFRGRCCFWEKQYARSCACVPPSRDGGVGRGQWRWLLGAYVPPFCGGKVSPFSRRSSSACL